MKYRDGVEIRINDRVTFDDHSKGVGVFSIDTAEYSMEYPESDWAYLKLGIMINSEKLGLVH